MDDQKQFAVTFVCGFCGSVERRDMPVALGVKRVRGCERCVVSTTACKGTKVRYEAFERARNAEWIDKILKRGEVYTLLKSEQWQHGCNVTLEEPSKLIFDMMIFTPAAYEPTDYHRLRLKLVELGGKFRGHIGTLELFNGDPCVWEGWLLNGCGIVVAHNSENIGLYDFVGEEGAPVEQDMAYLNERVARLMR